MFSIANLGHNAKVMRQAAASRSMRIRILDIPPEGLTVDFPLELAPLNARVHASDVGRNAGPSFIAAPHAEMNLQLEGSAVVVKGHVTGRYQTVCSRCIEPVEKSLDVPLDLVLKPEVTRSESDASAEDLHFGFYSGAEVDCAPFAEEFLILAVPFADLCREDCKGLCGRCGANLNAGPCGCTKETEPDERLQPLRALKQLLQ